jgi:hypothetical protein
MNRRMRRGAATLAAFAVAAVAASAQHGGETFHATASVTRGDARASAPVAITLTGYSKAADRAAVLAALRDGGTTAAKAVLATLEDVGAIELGGRRTPVKFAAARPTAAGHLITILTAEPMLFLSAGLPDARPRQGYDLAAAILDVRDDGGGLGELAPAAKIALDQDDAVLIDDYGGTVVWLQGLVRAR